jgi:hypothetical protein
MAYHRPTRLALDNIITEVSRIVLHDLFGLSGGNRVARKVPQVRGVPLKDRRLILHSKSSGAWGTFLALIN